MKTLCIPTFVLLSLVGGFGGRAHGRVWVVDQHHERATNAGPGNETKPFKSIAPAAAKAQPGDTVLVHQGVYRERVAPKRGGTKGHPIVYKAAEGETVTIKGSEVWHPNWQPVSERPGIWLGPFADNLFDHGQDPNPYATPLKAKPEGMTPGQLFIDGRPLKQVPNIEALSKEAGSWTANKDATGLHLNPPKGIEALANRKVELTVRSNVFAPKRRGLGYIHVKGFVIEHAANQFPSGFWANAESAQNGALSTSSGHHWRIEDNVVRYATAIGIDCGSQTGKLLYGQPKPENAGHHSIRNNRVVRNGCCGIAGWDHTATRIIDNVVGWNNRLRFTSPEIGGIKVHGFVDGLIKRNVVRHNEGHGIWLDNVYRHARVTRNTVIGNRAEGIFCEMGGGPVLIDHNVIGLTRPNLPQDGHEGRRGDGIYTHDASGVTVAHNLIFDNAHFGLYMRKVTDRDYQTADGERAPVGVSNQTIINNLIIGNDAGNLNLPYPGPHAANNEADHNVYSSWGPFFANKYGGTEVNDIVAAYQAKFGNEPKLKRYDGPGMRLDEWRAFMGWDKASAVDKHAGASLNPETWKLKLTVELQTLRTETRPIEGIDIDFPGRPLPKQDAIVGPFQDLKRGENRYSVWPILRKE